MISDQDLMLFVDGQASAELSSKIEALLESDASLMARLERMSRTIELVQEAFAPLLDRPVPDHLTAKVTQLIQSTGQTNPEAKVIAFPGPRAPRQFWHVPASVAAALVIGVLVGRVGLPAGPQADWITEPQKESPIAGKPIAVALSHTRSGQSAALSEGRKIIPVISFKTAQGDLCRQFRFVGPKDTHSGVACRNDSDQWRLVALTVGETPQSSAYDLAAGPGQDPVSMMVDKLILGAPLDAKAEAEALGQITK